MGFKVKKRRKMRRYRGSKGHGGGFRQKRRGKGNKGGKGMSGTGKRSSQKMQSGTILAREHGFEKYFGRQGYTSASTFKKENLVINLNDIQKVYADEKEIKLEGYKILGEGEGFKATIHAKSASKSAVEKMEKAGGKLVLEMTEVNAQREEKGKSDVKKQAKQDEKVAGKKAVAKKAELTKQVEDKLQQHDKKVAAAKAKSAEVKK